MKQEKSLGHIAKLSRKVIYFASSIFSALDMAFHFAWRNFQMIEEDYKSLEPFDDEEENDMVNIFDAFENDSDYTKLASDLERTGRAEEKLYIGQVIRIDDTTKAFICNGKSWSLRAPDPATAQEAGLETEKTILLRGKEIIDNEISCVECFDAAVTKILQKAFHLSSVNDVDTDLLGVARALLNLSAEQRLHLCELADGVRDTFPPQGYWSDEALKAKYLMLKDEYPDAVRALYAEASANCSRLKVNVYQRIVHTVSAIDWRPQNISFDINAIRASLDASHYHMDDAKKHLIEALVARECSHSKHTRAILLTGPQGVGKTSLVTSFANALRLPYVRVNLNGRNDSAVLTGSPTIYDNSEPGIVVTSAERYGTFRYVLHIDEIDKCGIVPEMHMANTGVSSLADSLLDLMEGKFWDLSLGMVIDTSQIIIVATANSISNINKLLLDRMDVIPLEDFFPEEKKIIAEDYIWPSLQREYDLPTEASPDAVQYVVEAYGAEPGARTIQKKLEAVTRHLLYEHVAAPDKAYPKKINSAYVRAVLGEQQKPFLAKNRYGTANILGVNENGGAVLQVQVDALPASKEHLDITGSPESCLQQSCRVAVRLAKQVLDSESETPSWDVHVHFTDTGMRKDGASAGLMIFLALVSQFLHSPLDAGLCGTGELDVKGNVYPVGGIRQKVAAAIRAGMTHMLVPTDNLDEAQKCIGSSNLELIPVENINRLLRKGGDPLRAESTSSYVLCINHGQNS